MIMNKNAYICPVAETIALQEDDVIRTSLTKITDATEIDAAGIPKTTW